MLKQKYLKLAFLTNNIKFLVSTSKKADWRTTSGKNYHIPQLVINIIFTYNAALVGEGVHVETFSLNQENESGALKLFFMVLKILK